MGLGPTGRGVGVALWATLPRPAGNSNALIYSRCVEASSYPAKASSLSWSEASGVTMMPRLQLAEELPRNLVASKRITTEPSLWYGAVAKP